MNIESLYKKAAELIIEKNNPSISLLRVELHLSLEEAEQVMDHLISIGLIDNYHGSTPRVKTTGLKVFDKPIKTASSLLPFDSLDGHQFELFCAELLRYNGFTNIKVTAESGDFGIDILCSYGRDSYAIQCKCYSHTVGNKAVQEAISGRIVYRCTKAVVMTNNYFTSAAEETARLADAELWDRHRLVEMLRIATQNGFHYQPRL